MFLTNNFYLGYGSLADWANVSDVREPVYAMLYGESRNGQFTRVQREYILFSQLHGNQVHYCRIPVALTEWVADKCMTPDGEIRRERAEQKWVVLRQWLVDSGFSVREAIPAMPNDFVLTEGAVDFLEHDPERGYFIRIDVPNMEVQS